MLFCFSKSHWFLDHRRLQLNRKISNGNGWRITTKLCKTCLFVFFSANIFFRSFTTILDACLGRSISDRPQISDRSLYFPFRGDQPIEYEPIQWQSEPSRFVVQPPSPSRILQPRNEPNIDQAMNDNTNIILLDDNDDQNYVDANGDEENEAPKTTKEERKKEETTTTSENDGN